MWKVARQKYREFRADKLPIYLLWTDTCNEKKTEEHKRYKESDKTGSN